MQEPFDLNIANTDYAVFPEGNDIYVIYKNGKEFAHIQKDTETQWLRLDPETATPLFDIDEEINAIGQAIASYVPGTDEDEESLDFGEEDEN